MGSFEILTGNSGAPLVLAWCHCEASNGNGTKVLLRVRCWRLGVEHTQVCFPEQQSHAPQQLVAVVGIGGFRELSGSLPKFFNYC